MSGSPSGPRSSPATTSTTVPAADSGTPRTSSRTCPRVRCPTSHTDSTRTPSAWASMVCQVAAGSSTIEQLTCRPSTSRAGRSCRAVSWGSSRRCGLMYGAAGGRSRTVPASCPDRIVAADHWVPAAAASCRSRGARRPSTTSGGNECMLPKRLGTHGADRADQLSSLTRSSSEPGAVSKQNEPRPRVPSGAAGIHHGPAVP